VPIRTMKISAEAQSLMNLPRYSTMSKLDTEWTMAAQSGPWHYVRDSNGNACCWDMDQHEPVFRRPSTVESDGLWLSRVVIPATSLRKNHLSWYRDSKKHQLEMMDRHHKSTFSTQLHWGINIRILMNRKIHRFDDQPIRWSLSKTQNEEREHYDIGALNAHWSIVLTFPWAS
jgi:hypothetical protein